MHMQFNAHARRGSLLGSVGAVVLSCVLLASPALAEEDSPVAPVPDTPVTPVTEVEPEEPQVPTYTLTVAYSAGGYVGVPGEDGQIVALDEGPFEVEQGASQSFTLVPEEGFVVGSVVYNDEVHDRLLNSFSVTPTKDTDLSVTFVSETEAGLSDTTPGFHKTESSEIYYRDENGKLAFGRTTIDGGTYVFRSNGTMLTGWQTMTEGKLYFGTDGRMREGWETIGSDTYFFDTSGAVLTGWQRLDGRWYYFRSGGPLTLTADVPRKGWVSYEGAWYWFDAEYILKSGWQYIDGQWYYLRSNGTMVTGWQVINNKWYYFGTSGTMHRGWVFVDGWYYLGTDGAMRTGWFWVDEAWYATSKSGRCLMDTWGNDGSDYDYYFGPTGAWTGQQRKHVG